MSRHIYYLIRSAGSRPGAGHSNDTNNANRFKLKNISIIRIISTIRILVSLQYYV